MATTDAEDVRARLAKIDPRDGLPNKTCETCGESRNLLDFYDEDHYVNLIVEPSFGIVVDHGEIKYENSRRQL